MNPYYFVGSECELYGAGGAKLSRFGQKIMLADDVAKTMVIGGAQLLPELQWLALNVTDAEAKAYPHAGQQRIAPEAFTAKLKAAWAAVAAYRAELEAPVPEAPQEGR